MAIWCSSIPACQPSAVFWIFLPWDSLLNPLAFLQILHKLSSLLYTSQVYFFKYGLKSFFSLATNWKELTYNKRKWHSNMNPQSVKCLTHSQQLPHVSLIKGCYAPVLVVKGRLHKALGPISARQLCYMCMPMRPNKAGTAVHGCHYLGQKPIGLLPGWYGCAYARPLVGVWACHLLLLFEKSYLSGRLCQMCVNSHNKNRMTHSLRVAKNCTTHPLPRAQKLMTHPLSAPAHPPILFDQSLRSYRGSTISSSLQPIMPCLICCLPQNYFT